MWNYKADLIRVIDGDTVVLKLHKDFQFDVDFGFNIKEKITISKSTEVSFRLLGINAPEMSVLTKSAGTASKDELEKILKSGDMSVTTYKPDKYGRWLVTIEIKNIDGSFTNVNDHLVKNGFAKPYMVSTIVTST